MPTKSFLLSLVAAFLVCFAGSAKAEGGTPPAPASEQTPPAKQGAENPVKPEARREDVEPDTLAEAKTALKTARADRDKAEKDLKAAEDLLANTEKERNDARAELADVKEQLTTANAANKAGNDKFDKLTAAVKSALGLTDEQVANLISDGAIIPNAIEQIATKKAITIAASQGVPPVITDPKAESGDDAKADFEAASKESDPMKRAQMFAAASERLAKQAKKPSGNN